MPATGGSDMTIPTRQQILHTLRVLERKGLIESRLDECGQVRWFTTEKGKRLRPDEVDVPDERLN
jgi:DNA-binding PadR family transcriptional regulator